MSTLQHTYTRSRQADWRDAAACLALDTNLFFPVGETGDAADQAVAAKAVCRGCPVRDECLAFAMATNQQAGIFGGLDEDERRSLRRRLARERRRAS